MDLGCFLKFLRFENTAFHKEELYEAWLQGEMI